VSLVRLTCNFGAADRSLSRSQRFKRYRMTVLFDSVGYKTLSVPVVVQQQLLVAT
jgi:hypothetical protein